MSTTPFNDRQVKIGNVVIKVMSRANTWIFRMSRGRWGAKFPGGAPICLLTTTGRRSGKARTAPLLYLRDGDDVIIVASKGGMPQHPEWYLNIEANPEVELEIGDQKGSYTARTAKGEQRSQLWEKLVVMYEDYDDYQARTEREIPVIVCTPA